ncbi:hypothetical protein UFOVP738_5 [uncultured Caudovirales phage]|uniref:Uncharacterized protein n=1 Tax=uncultured Caudovirales phage TaxID=2100421 RepID=A0A6J7X0D9_9CAUD|nr:hypothetical protein UFOVP738_5 [uncultured Caudovirales phage]
MATPTNLPATQTSGNVLTAAWLNDLRGAFRILQVVSASTSTAVASSSSTLADTGLTATITPQSSSSKILVYVAHPQCFKATPNGFTSMNLAILRGSTNIQTVATVAGFTGTSQDLVFSLSGIALDSPATTSATTYKTQFASQFGTASVSVQYGSAGTSTIILMEVSA